MSATICEEGTYTVGTQILDASNVGFNSITLDNAAANGCDSIVNLTLSITSIDLGLTVNNQNFISNQNGATYQWFDCFSMLTIIDSTNQSINIDDSDFSYGVIITLNGCVDTSECLTQLNIHNNYLENKLSIYPNPAKHQIQIEGLQHINSIQSIFITTVSGKQLTIHSTNSVISITDLTKGIYFLNIVHTEGVEKLRFIKN